MKHFGLRLLFTTVFMATSLSLAAQNRDSTYDKPTEKTSKIAKTTKEAPKVTTEFGLSAGALYNFMEVTPVGEGFTQKITGCLGAKVPGNLGAVVALQFRLNIGKCFGIQPEVLYSYTTMKFTGPEYNNAIKAKCNLVQMPVLLSFRAAMFRFNFGPVFTLTDNPSYQLVDKTDNSIKTEYLGPLNPIVTYTAGISVKLSRRTIIDARWSSQFTDTKIPNEFRWSLDKNEQAEPIQFRIKNSSVQVRLGLVF